MRCSTQDSQSQMYAKSCGFESCSQVPQRQTKSYDKVSLVCQIYRIHSRSISEALCVRNICIHLIVCDACASHWINQSLCRMCVGSHSFTQCCSLCRTRTHPFVICNMHTGACSTMIHDGEQLPIA